MVEVVLAAGLAVAHVLNYDGAHDVPIRIESRFDDFGAALATQLRQRVRVCDALPPLADDDILIAGVIC